MSTQKTETPKHPFTGELNVVYARKNVAVLIKGLADMFEGNV